MIVRAHLIQAGLANIALGRQKECGLTVISPRYRLSNLRSHHFEGAFRQGGEESGDRLFADQIKVKLDASPDRPRDVAILIDTSGSQAGESLKSARMLTEAVVKNARPQDRVGTVSGHRPV